MSEIDIQPSSFNQPLPTPSSKNGLTAGLIGALVTLIVVSGLFGGYLYLSKTSDTELPEEDSESTEVEAESGEDSEEKSEKVSYTKPTKTTTPDVFNLTKDETGYSTGQYSYENSTAYIFGTINEGKYKGGKLILLDYAFDGMGGGPNYVRLIKPVKGKYVLLENYSKDYEFNEAKIIRDSTFKIDEFEIPKELVLGASNKKVFLVENYNLEFDKEGKSVYVADENVGEVYIDTKPDQGSYNYNGFYIVLPDGTARAYEYKPRFIGEDKVPQITFSDGTKNSIQYFYTSVTGCGSSNYINLTTKAELANATIIGKTSTGSDVYLPNYNSKLLSDSYKFHIESLPLEDRSRLNFDMYVNQKPILLFEDPFDRVAVLTNANFVPAAECGKPVIYLYPEKTSKIRVEVDPVGGFTFTEPAYDTGWNVVATPDSKIYEIEDPTQKIWPYLFWEGRGGLYKAPTKGFMVKQADVDKFLTDKLSYLGFNETEIYDFKEFWVPRMKKYPYYFIGFMGNNVMDQLAPLTITPKPDTVIRVLMDYKGYNKPVKVTEPVLPKGPERKGFTVTEWGGVIQ